MDEDTIRRIVREEIRTALEVLSAEATDLPSYDSDHIEDVAAHVVARAADYAVSTLKHAPDCAKRSQRGWARCSCETGDY
ncbi:hypothetical protein [Streptomyces sp. NRRL S-378]|uniref:hypothetical protein n=1 Tax=Streptomyces sp. NRRL S-378 TaxID=1463904 RepID=UPI0004C4DE0F|nr:hypothetical protein [Streptomyces sp. NRRL S-378]